MRQEWHIDSDDLAGYAAGNTGPVMLSSIESHLVACEACRTALADHVNGVDREVADDRVWAGIVDRVDRGKRPYTRSSRLLHVSISSPPLALATTLLAGLLIGFVCLARLGEARYATTVLVSIGPLVPLIGARLAFSQSIDPAGSMATASPLAAGRVASTRALVVATIACLAGILVSPLTTMSAADSMVWLLPAVAVSAVIVAISTYVDSTIPTVAFAGGWLLVVGAWLTGVPRGLRGVSTDGIASHRPAVQLTLLLATVVAVAVCIVRRDSNPSWRSVA